MAEILVPTDTFLVDIDGERVVFHKGVTRVRAGHPVIEGREDLFEPLTVDYDVEQATAAPGEKRTTRRATSKSTSTKD